MSTQVDPPLTRGEMIRAIIGLFVVDALANIALLYWSARDPHIAGPMLYFFMLPLANLFAVFLAFMQLHYYRHPEQDSEEESEAESVSYRIVRIQSDNLEFMRTWREFPEESEE